MKKISFFFLVILMGLISCKDDEAQIIENTQIIYRNTDSTLVLDSVIGRPYSWATINNNSIKKYIDLGPICKFCDDVVLDAYWGTGGSNWLRLPFVDNINNVAVNYQYGGQNLVLFAYGDSAVLADHSYWDELGFDMIRVKANIPRE